MKVHRLEHGIGTAHQSVGNINHPVAIDDEKRLRMIVDPGKTQTLAFEVAGVRTLMAVARPPRDRSTPADTSGAFVTLNGKEFDLLKDGPLQLCRDRHHDGRLPGTLSGIKCRNESSVPVEFDVLVGWQDVPAAVQKDEPKPAKSEPAKKVSGKAA